MRALRLGTDEVIAGAMMLLILAAALAVWLWPRQAAPAGPCADEEFTTCTVDVRCGRPDQQPEVRLLDHQCVLVRCRCGGGGR